MPTRECPMGILYNDNANATPAMNDSSVTSGNADGWIYATGSHLEANAPRSAAEQSVRRPPDGRSSASSAKSAKPRKR